MPRSVTVRVPATSANMGPGFDSLGVALDLTGQVRLSIDPGDDSGSAAQRPAGPAERIIHGAARAAYLHAGRSIPPSLRAEYEGSLPVGRGLGASAVLRVGAILAASRLLGDSLSRDAVAELASELEGHADNVAPAVFGGFQVVVWDGGTLTRVSVPLPHGLRAVVLVPELEMPTSESRKLLPEQLTRADAVHNIGRAALLVAALATGRLDALRVASEDLLHQPARALIFPALFPIVESALQAGALCAYLSGGGSAVLALTNGDTAAIGGAMLAAAESHGSAGHVLVTGLRDCGAEIVEDTGPP